MAKRRRLEKLLRRMKKRKRRKLLFSRRMRRMKSMSVRINRRRCPNKIVKKVKLIMARRSQAALL